MGREELTVTGKVAEPIKVISKAFGNKGRVGCWGWPRYPMIDSFLAGIGGSFSETGIWEQNRLWRI